MSDFFDSNWNKLKDQARRSWGKLSEDSMEKLDGDFENLSNRIRRALGFGKDQAKHEIEKFKNGLNN